MADAAHLAILRSGVDAWNAWRAKTLMLAKVDLTSADLSGANLRGANLRGAKLCRANLSRANLVGAVFNQADLRGANLEGADIFWARFRGADLRGANLRRARRLGGAVFTGARFDADMELPRPASVEEPEVETLPRVVGEPGPPLGASDAGEHDE